MNTLLKSAREDADLTQVEVAIKAQISERQYIRIEKGLQDPRTATSIRIAKALNSTVESLFGAATSNKAKEPDGDPADK